MPIVAAVGYSPLTGPASYILYDNQIRSYIQTNGGTGHSRRKHTRRGSDDYGWNSAGDRQPHGDGPRHDPGPDRESREKEIAEERVRREQEREEERRRSERQREESEHCITEMRRQMERLQDMFTERSATTISARGHRTAEPIKLTKLTDEDDIESYLTTFERIMAANEVSQDRWSFQLAPQLTGKAQQAYAALPPEKAKTYDTVKEAVLRLYDINEETYRQRFLKLRPQEGESPQELITRLKDLAARWARESKSRGALLDLIVREQFLAVYTTRRRPSCCHRKAAQGSRGSSPSCRELPAGPLYVHQSTREEERFPNQ